jgi:TonB family protein
MSSLSMPLSGKVPERQFLGDLMSLFERRKLKCGDPQIFETFTSELASNNILRSDLFTLCTAISHMAAEDLSGEELLELVARALSGPAIAKGGAPPEIPEGMRTAFLDGYKAWSNRGSALDEPLPWPPVRQMAQREELPATPVTGDASSDPSASKEPVESHRTMQEALNIARERSGSPLIMPRMAASAANLEQLTISELKKLMSEIEHQVSRIGPHAGAADAAVGSPAADVAGRESAGTGGADVRATEPAAPGDISRALRGAVLPFEPPGRPAPAPEPVRSKFDEAAFLERHPYMNATGRVLTREEAAAVPPTPVAAAPMAAAPVAPLVTPEPVTPPAGSATVAAATGMANADAATPPVATEVASAQPVASATPVVAVPAVRFAALLPAPVVQPPTFGRPGMFDAPSWIDPDGPRLRFRMSLRAIALMGALFLVAGGSTGFYVYHSLHPKTIDDFPDLKPLVAGGGGAQGSAAGSGAEVILSGSDDPLMGMNSPAGERVAPGSERLKPKPKAPSTPAAAVWPESIPAVSAGADANSWTPSAGALAVTKHAGGSSTAVAPAHRTAVGPLHVPSTTMMGYAVSAPRPVYPAGILKGITGTVVVEVAVSREGTVTGAWAVSGPDDLRLAAVQAVQAWQFRPYMVDGNPAEVTTTLGFFFNGR